MRFLLSAAVWTLAAGAAEIPKGTEFEIRLLSKVSSTNRKRRTRSKRSSSPCAGQGAVAIASGTKIKGEIANVKSPADAQRAGDDGARLSTGSWQPPARRVPVKGRITKVDNSREVVDENGKIIGILASETISAKMDEGLQKLGGNRRASAGILNAAKSVADRRDGREHHCTSPARR